jgi:hypothetical protein
MTTINSSRTMAVVVAVAALAGCGAGGGDRTQVTVSARSAAQKPSGAAAAAAGGVAVAGGVTLERVKLVVREIELERHAAGAGGAAAGDDDGTPDQGRGDAPGTKGGADDGTADQGPGDAPGTAGADGTAGDDDGTPDQGRGDAPGTAGAGGTRSGEVEVSAGPYLVDLSGEALSSGQIVEQFTLDVAEGTYDELKFRIHHLGGGRRLEDADLGAGQDSVVVTGTLADGRAFTFRSRLNEQLKMRGTFVIGGPSPSNITLSIDPSGWFVGPDGAPLDPTVESSRGAIERNIRASIDAFDDDDHDGADDHGRGGADDGPGHDAGDDRGGGQDDGPNHT